MHLHPLLEVLEWLLMVVGAGEGEGERSELEWRWWVMKGISVFSSGQNGKKDQILLK